MSMTLETRNATLADLAATLKEQHGRKLDVVAQATAIRAKNGRLTIAGSEPVLTEDGVDSGDGVYVPTSTCDEGIALKLNVPPSYLRRLRIERPDMFDANVNGLLHGKSILRAGGEREVIHPAETRSFLVRCFRGEDGGPGIARAFLSDRYGIVDNLDVLMSALDGVRRAGVAVDIDGCDLTERRMYVRVVAPAIAAYAPDLLAGYRSPFGGQDAGRGFTPERMARMSGGQDTVTDPIVFAGFVISNSETGGGAFTLTPRLVVKVCNNGLTITADVLRAVHLGGKMDDGVIQWSADTQRKSLELVTSRTADAVSTFLNVEYVRKQVARIEESAGKPVSDASKTIETLSKKLLFTDTEQASILDHFIRGGQLTAGGVMQAVTSVAQTITDADRAHEVESTALRALALAAA
jgi:hypothetical protein